MNLNNNELLSIKNINKQFPGVKALDNASLSIKKGEVMALLGENGAGKSTLVKVLSGAYTRDSGDISLDGKVLPKVFGPTDARDFGVAIIYQELSLLSQLSVAENIYLTHEPVVSKLLPYVKYNDMDKEAKKQLEKLDASHINTKEKVDKLALPEKQMVEIAKALAVECKIIIMDEPTTSLTWEETKRLFKVIDMLKKQGVAVIYISHRLDEIFEIADSATVMRDGKVVGNVSIENTTKEHIISMMTGKEFKHREKSNIDNNSCKKIIFEAENITDGKFIKDISFHVNENEVLGFGGLVGSKRTELARMIFGADKLAGGNLRMFGEVISNNSPSQAIQNKIGYLSENRKEDGLNLGLTIEDNIILTDTKSVSSNGIINQEKVTETCNGYMEKMSIKGKLKTTVLNLSGGNQQKVAIAKLLHAGCQLLIFDEPTRGIDVAAKAEIYKMIRDFVKSKNRAAIVISSEVNELVDVCDRVYIMSKGEITKELSMEEITSDNILHGITTNGRSSK